MDTWQIRRLLQGQRDQMRAMVERDPEQEVRGIAIAPIDAMVCEARRIVGDDHPVVVAVRDVIHLEDLAGGEPHRCADLLLVVQALLDALPPKPADVPTRIR